MTVGELIEQLKQYDPDLPVVVDYSGGDVISDDVKIFKSVLERDASLKQSDLPCVYLAGN